jgi:hypothetical protein
MVTSPPPTLPDCDEGKDPNSSLGEGDEPNTAELLSCLAAFETRNFDKETTSCPWLFTPPKPKATAQERNVEVVKERARMQELIARGCANTPSAECMALLSPPSR